MFPSWETLPHERLSPGVDTVGARLMLLRRLAHPDDAAPRPAAAGRGHHRAVAAAADGARRGRDRAGDADRRRRGRRSTTVIARLVELAYTRVDMVGKRGEFAVRGGILDVFPPTAEHPVRVEFWGDEVTEMRMFSVADQRSIPEIAVDSVIAVPCRELLLTDDVRDRAAELAAEHPVQENSVPGSVPDMLAKLAEGIPVDGMEALLPVLRPDRPGDCCPTTCRAGTPLLVCDPEKVRTRAADLIKTGREFLEASWSMAAVGGDAPIDIEAARRVGVPSSSTTPAIAARDGRAPVVDAEPACPTSRRSSSTSGPRRRRGASSHSVDEIFAMLRAHVATGGYAAVVTPGTGTAHRVVEQLAESDTPATMLEPGAHPEGRRGRRAQGPAARRCGDAGRQPRRDHRDRPDRQPGRPPPRASGWPPSAATSSTRWR